MRFDYDLIEFDGASVILGSRCPTNNKDIMVRPYHPETKSKTLTQNAPYHCFLDKSRGEFTWNFLIFISAKLKLIFRMKKNPLYASSSLD